MNKENLVEKAMLQMKQIEELVAENAKGILASTMKEEINSLVKESLLSEQALEDDDELIPTDDSDMDATDVDDTDVDVDNTEMDVDMEVDSEEPDMGVDLEDDEDEDVLDLRDIKDDAALLTVFKAMKDEDGIIVSKSGEDIHLKDENSDNEYLIKMAESIKKRRLMEMEGEMDEQGEDDYLDSAYEDRTHLDDDHRDKFNWMDDEEYEDDEEYDEDDEIDNMFEGWDEDEITLESDELDEDDDRFYELTGDHDYGDEEEYSDEDEETYEIDLEDEEGDDELDAFFNEKLKLGEQSRARRSNEDYRLSETKGKMTTKPKGMGMGSPSKFKYKSKPNQEKGFDTKMKEGPKTKGTGKAKFDYKEGENMDGKTKKVTPKMGKTETKEAARTYAMGSKENRGLRKGVTPNRNHVYEADVNALKAKNEEYKKALNVFREKLNEVAVFNSNLAYATRLFTEHSTTKKEKINILRRFDDVQSLKESKSLYSTIKNELAETINNTIKESVAVKINNTASTGSSANLIESTTYESPQFLRMKDLMNKIK